MICDKCVELGKKTTGVFTTKERVQILTSTATMLKHLEANPNAPAEDKLVANSIVTKVLLSFDLGARNQFLQMLRQSAGVDITLKHCGHGVIGVV